jgi:hypothetical protein
LCLVTRSGIPDSQDLFFVTIQRDSKIHPKAPMSVARQGHECTECRVRVDERVQVVSVTAVISLPMTIPRTPCSLENVIVSENNLINEFILFVQLILLARFYTRQKWQIKHIRPQSAGHPVRSAIHKQLNGRLVLRWVTTWESLLLYVLTLSLCYFC